MPNKLALLGLFILSYLLYRRLFKIRLPKEIIATQDLLIISIPLLLCVSTFIMACISLYTFIKFWLNKEEESQPTANPLLIKFITLYQSKWNPMTLFQNSLFALDIYVKNKIPMYDHHRDYLDLVLMFISKFFCKYEQIFLFIFIFIPLLFQGIVTISFFTDIFFYEKFYYFYKNLWLLTFPLITKYLLHSLKALVDTNLTSLESVLTLKAVNTSDFALYKEKAVKFDVSIQDWKYLSANTPAGVYSCINSLSYEFTKNKPILDHGNTLKYCVESMVKFLAVDSFLDKYAILKKKILLPFNILKYLIFSLGWGYVLYLILQ